MKSTFVIIFVLFYFTAFAQKRKDYLISYEVEKDGFEKYGYKQRNGKVVIEAQFTSIYTDTLYNMAIVLKDWRWVGIDRNARVILHPFIYDNGPDYVKEGLFRFVEHEKLGFANLDGKKLIPAQYSFVTPFVNGLAQYFLGGERVASNGKTVKQILKESGRKGMYDMHWSWGGNVKQSGYLNKQNKRFKEVSPLEERRRTAITWENKHVLLDRDGKIIPTKTKSTFKN